VAEAHGLVLQCRAVQLGPMTAVLALVASTSCAEVQVRKEYDDKVIRKFTERHVVSAWSRRADAKVVAPGGGQAPQLEIEAFRDKACVVTTGKVVDRTISTVRTGEREYMRTVSYVTGGVGLAALVPGIILFTQYDPKAASARGVGTAAVLLSIVGLAGVVTGGWQVVEDVRLMDSRDHVGPVVVSVPDDRRCDREALAGATVRVETDKGEKLVEAKADESGQLTVPIDRDRAAHLGDRYGVVVDGKLVRLLVLPSGIAQSRSERGVAR